jgi:DNA-binding transcriptional ArsR family regulator
LPFYRLPFIIAQPNGCTMTTNDEAAMDRLLRALADTSRRGLLDRLRDRPGLTLGELGAGFAFTRQALSKHLAALEVAELVIAVWRGREKLHYLNPVPLQALPARWVTTSSREHNAALSALSKALSKDGPAAPRTIGGPAAQLAAGPGLDGTAVRTVEQLAAARAYLEGSAGAVRALLDALPADAGYDKPAGGGFSLAEHLQHLADIETLGWRVRFERLLAETKPRLAGVDGDRLAIERRYQERPWRGAARRFVAERLRTLRALARFDATTLAKPALFAGRKATAGDVLAAMVAHDLEHRTEMAVLWTAHMKENPR